MFGEHVHLLAPLLTAAIFIAVVPALDPQANSARAVVTLLCAAVGVRYGAWRLFATVLPADGSAAQVGWIWFCYALELAALLEILIFLLILSRRIDRSREADAAEARLLSRAAETWPTVDVLIPTYNEGLDVLEKTIVGALALDYPRVRVWICDDGKRSWLAAFCAAHGAGYITREDNAHAKAGNINHALARTDGTLVAILDADFVPHRAFLRRVVGLFDDPAIGIVQTPQHFYNPDPIQSNLLLHRVWPDEQRLFFDVMAPCRDAWNAAFCCGSCSVMRRDALQAIGGGVPTASVTEDLLTTLAMLRKGYVTRYLNERLSHGLAPESIEAFFVQRARWARGAIQSLYLKDGLLGPGLNWLQRILFFPVSWLIQYPVRLMALLIPVVYLWTGLTPLLFTGIDDLLAYQLPMILAFALGMRWLAPHHYMPFLSNAAGSFATFRLWPVILHSLIRPFGQSFRVTPKGDNVQRRRIDTRSLSLTAALIVLTIGGLMLNTMPELQRLESRSFFPVAAAWSFYNLLILLLVAMICIEAPRRRKEERFPVDEPALLINGDLSAACRTVDLSLTGIRVRMDDGCSSAPWNAGRDVTVVLTGLGRLPAVVVQHSKPDVRLAFRPLPEPLRHRLIAKLFGGDHDNGVRRLQMPSLLRALLQRCFGVMPAAAPSGAPAAYDAAPVDAAEAADAAPSPARDGGSATKVAAAG